MKICHVITRMIVGGAQENTLYTVQGHLEKGHQVTLVTGPSSGPEGKLLEKFCPPGMELIEVPSLVRQLNPWKDWCAYRSLVKIFRAGGYDVVHTHSSKAGVVGRLAARKAGVPFVCHTVHGQAFHQYQSSLKNALYIRAERFAARRCDRIFAVAQAMIDQCVDAKVAPREKYGVVYSGMDLESFVNARRDPELGSALGIAPSSLVIGMVARLFELKGHADLLKAAPAIAARFPEVRFLIVGDGILRDSLEAEISRLGLTENFIFTGLVPPGEIPKYVGQMDILAHLSWREGLPRACVQALAAAKPVLAYPLDGTPEVVIPGETGLLCHPGNAEEIAAGLLRLLEDAELRRRFGAAGQKLVLSRFDWHRMAEILEGEYLAGLENAQCVH